jgi:hypothetical protein
MSTLTVSFPHLGQEKNLGKRFLGIRTTFFLLRPMQHLFYSAVYVPLIFMLALK